MDDIGNMVTARIEDTFETVILRFRATTIPGVFYILELTRLGFLSDASFITDLPDDGSIITIGASVHFVVFTERSSPQKMIMKLSHHHVSSLVSRTKEWRLAVQEIFKTPVEDINTIKSLLEFV